MKSSSSSSQILLSRNSLPLVKIVCYTLGRLAQPPCGAMSPLGRIQGDAALHYIKRSRQKHVEYSCAKRQMMRSYSSFPSAFSTVKFQPAEDRVFFADVKIRKMNSSSNFDILFKNDTIELSRTSRLTETGIETLPSVRR